MIAISLIVLQSCATIINDQKQHIKIYTTDSSTVSYGVGTAPAFIDLKPVKGYAVATFDRANDYSIIVKDDSTVAKATLKSVFEPKWIGYNFYNYQIGSFMDFGNGKIYNHQDVRVVQFPKDSALVEDYASSYFQKQLASCKSYQQANDLLEENRAEVPFMAKWLSAILASLSFPLSTLLLSKEGVDWSLIYGFVLTAPVYLGLVSAGIVWLLGKANNEEGGFGPAIGSYYGGYLVGLFTSVFAVAAFPSIFHGSYSTSSVMQKVSVFSIALMPYVVAALFTVIGYNNSRTRYILARPKSLSLTEGLTNPNTRSFSFDLPSIGVRLLQTPTLQLVPAVTLNFLQVHF